MTNPRSFDQMLALFVGDTATKTASAPVVDAPVSAPAATPTPAPSTPSIEAAAQKIASAEDAQMRTTAAAFGAEFGKAAAAELEKSPVFAKTASAPGAAVDINQAAVDAAFRAGMLKGASDMVDTWRSAYAKNLQAEHDMLTVVHLSGQAHGAALRKHASDVVEKQKLVDGGQLKQADAEVTLPASLPLVSARDGRLIQKIADGVPFSALLPGIGPSAAMVTAPTGHGVEARERAIAGGGLGSSVGRWGGGLLGAGIGAGIGATSDAEDPTMQAALYGLLGGGVGALAGTIPGHMIGSHMALSPIYNQPQRMELAQPASPPIS